MQSLMGMDLEAVRTHMHEVLRVLNNFGKLREPGRQRREYLTQLRHDIAAYYGYSEWMVAKILNLFTLNEVRPFDRRLCPRSRYRVISIANLWSHVCVCVCVSCRRWSSSRPTRLLAR